MCYFSSKLYCMRGVLLLTILFISSLTWANDIRGIGVPYIQNYTKAQYQSGNQNWSVTKDEKNIVYFGNSEGLLSFDGRYWQQYQMPNRVIIRSVAADGHGRIYAGGYGEFGYWHYDEKGLLSYVSLTRLVPAGHALSDEIWKIYIDRGRVYFQSFASVFVYEKGKIRVIKQDAPFLFMFKVKDRMFIEVISKGLFELKGAVMHRLPGSELLGEGNVLTILPYKGDSYLIGTAKKGLFLFDGRAIRPWINEADAFLKTYQLNNGSVVMGKYYAFGTILNGIIIINEDGRVIQKINKSSGLQNNTVLSLYNDDGENLWIGLDNGIDRIELSSSLYFYFDKRGELGTVYSSILHNNKIYLGTNQGLYYSTLNTSWNGHQPMNFKFVKGSQGQVWDLSLIDGQLLCGHNDGTFRVKGTAMQKISGYTGGWTIKRANKNPDYLLQGTYNGLVVYRKDGAGQWELHNKVEDFNAPSRYVEQDAKGIVWVGHAYKGVYKLELSKDMKKALSVKYYSSSNGLPANYNINVFSLSNRIVFSSDNGFYIYDELSDSFHSYDQLNNILGSFASSNKVIAAEDKTYWFINHGKVALVNLQVAGKATIDSTQFAILNGKMVQYYENISKIDRSNYLISFDEGFCMYTGGLKPAKRRIFPKVLIRKIENITDKATLLSEAGGSETLSIPYKLNNIRISYSLPYYKQAKVRYQYFLDGYSKQWSEWSPQAAREFTNLGHGLYTFKVRASIDGQAAPDITEFRFSIASPWYFTKTAIAFYVLLHVIVFLWLKHLYELKLKRHKLKIQEKLQQEKEEHLRQEASENERKLIELKNEQLESDLKSKNRELANSAMNMVYKNELLQKIRAEVMKLKQSDGKALEEHQLRRISKVIDEGLSDDRGWGLFEESFNEAQEDFFKKLKKEYPDLVPNDLKLCAFLRMNMTSKEIASLLNISLRGVEIRRYRLRKKLNLEHDKNLVEFLMEV